MKNSYDFSKSIKNPYPRKPKKQLTNRLDEDTIEYFRSLSEDSGIPYQSQTNLYLGIVILKVLFDKETEYRKCIILQMAGIVYPGIVIVGKFVHSARSKQGETDGQFCTLIATDPENLLNSPYEALNRISGVVAPLALPGGVLRGWPRCQAT